MDRSILTPQQQVTVAGLRVLNNMRDDEIVIDGVTVADVRRRSLNREFEINGIEGVRLVESQVHQTGGQE